MSVWEDNARKTISELAATLRDDGSDCRSMIPTVRDLAEEVGRQNRFRQVEHGDSVPMMNQMACEIRIELENLEAALSADDVAKALEHAEAALQVLK